MNTYVVHLPNGGVAVTKAESPTHALAQHTDARIRTEHGLITAGKYSVVIPVEWR